MGERHSYGESGEQREAAGSFVGLCVSHGDGNYSREGVARDVGKKRRRAAGATRRNMEERHRGTVECSHAGWGRNRQIESD